MKKLSLLQVAKAVRRFDKNEKVDGLDQFSMSYWWTNRVHIENKVPRCKTVGCIAGTAVALGIEKGLISERFDSSTIHRVIPKLAVDLIKKPPGCAYSDYTFERFLENLFSGEWYWITGPRTKPMIRITASEAAKATEELYYYLKSSG